MAKLGDLIVDLQVNTAALRSGLDSASGKLASFGDSVKGISAQLGAMMAWKGVEFAADAIKSLGEFIIKGSEAADKMGKLSQAAGVPVEAFSRLAYGAQLSGVSTEELGGAFNHLNKNLAAAGAGTKEQARLFSALGVQVRDSSGHVRASAEVMTELSDRFSRMEDGASKSALAMEVFGKSGASLLPFLNTGAAGLKRLSDESDRFGITISAGASKATEEFNDNLQKLQLATQAVAQRVAGELAPMLTELTNKLLSSKDGVELLSGAATVLVATVKGLVSAGMIVGAVWDVLGTTLGRVASAIVDAAHGDFGQLLLTQSNFNDDVIASVETTTKRIAGLWTTTGDALAASFASGAFRAAGTLKKLSADSILALAKNGPGVRPDSSNGHDAMADLSMAAAMQLDSMRTEAKAAADSLAAAGGFMSGAIQGVGEEVASVTSTLGDVMREFGQRALGALGDAGDVISSAAQGFASGGPAGAIVGALAAIAVKLQDFGRISDSMNKYLGQALQMINGTIGPIVDGFLHMSEAFTELTKTVLQTSGALEIIYAVLFALGKVFDVLALSALYVAKFFTQMTGGNTKSLDDQIKDTLYDLSKGYHQVDVLPPPLKDAATALDKLGDSAGSVTAKFGEMLTNIPSGYKVGAAVFGATAAAGGAAGAAAPWDFSQTGFDVGDLLQGADYTPVFDANGSMTGAGSQQAGNAGGGNLGVGGAGGAGSQWTQEQLQAFLNAYQAAISAGATDEQATQAATMAANAAGRGSSSSAATAASSSGGGGIQSVSNAATPPIHIENVHLGGAKDLDSLVKLFTEVQDQHAGQKRRNPSRSKRRP